MIVTDNLTTVIEKNSPFGKPANRQRIYAVFLLEDALRQAVRCVCFVDGYSRLQNDRATVGFFRDKMHPKQWTEDSSETHEQDGFGQLVFRKEKAWIKVHLTDLADGKGYHGMVEGTGLVAENDPRRSQPTAIPDTPTSSAVDVSKRLEAVREQIIREATKSGLSPEQVEQMLQHIDPQLVPAETKEAKPK